MNKLKFSFLPIPEEIMSDLTLSWGAKYLFGILAKTGYEEIKWSKKKLAERMNVKIEEVRRRIIELKNKELITIDRQDGKINTYKINFYLIQEIQGDLQMEGASKVEMTPISKVEGGLSMHTNRIIKENIKEHINLIQEIFNYWNSKNIVIHKQIRIHLKNGIKKALKQYKIEEIKELINFYDIILKNDRYFWTYKWNLTDFLKRGLKTFEGKQLNDYLKSELKNKTPRELPNYYELIKEKSYVK